MKRLFIIGNGFDVAHGFKTRYSDFKAWIENQLPDASPADTLPLAFFSSGVDPQEDYIDGLKFLKELFDSNIDLDDEWNSFENSLTSLPIYEKCQDLIDFTVEPNEAFDNPARYDDVSIDIAGLIQKNISMIPDYFREWIESVDIGNPSCELLVSDYFSSDSIFINFNYTETLENVYGIPESQICHIHGDRCVLGDKLIVGHSESYNVSEQKLEFDCPGVSPMLDEAIALLEKDTDYVIEHNKAFLCNLDDSITDVYAYGFAFGPQDIPYVNYICKHINSNATWHLSDYDSETKRREIADLLKSLGCKGNILTFNHGSK